MKFIISASILIVLLTMPLTSGEMEEDLDLHMTSPYEMKYLVVSNYTANESSELRVSIDQMGNNNSIVNGSEINDYQNFIEENLVGSKTQGTFINNIPLRFLDADIAIRNAEGNTSSEEYIETTSAYSLSFNFQPGTKKMEITLKARDYNRTFRLKSPEGWNITRKEYGVIGLIDENFTNNETMVSGNISKNLNVLIKISLPVSHDLNDSIEFVDLVFPIIGLVIILLGCGWLISYKRSENKIEAEKTELSDQGKKSNHEKNHHKDPEKGPISEDHSKGNLSVPSGSDSQDRDPGNDTPG